MRIILLIPLTLFLLPNSSSLKSSYELISRTLLLDVFSFERAFSLTYRQGVCIVLVLVATCDILRILSECRDREYGNQQRLGEVNIVKMYIAYELLYMELKEMLQTTAYGH